MEVSPLLKHVKQAGTLLSGDRLAGQLADQLVLREVKMGSCAWCSLLVWESSALEVRIRERKARLSWNLRARRSYWEPFVK